jgi:uncharacterized protein
MPFAWDDEKTQSNFRQHGIRFEEAAQIFAGPILTRVDAREVAELREISFGLIGAVVVLAVVHTDREGVTRIIGARKATKQESRLFHAYLKEALG